MVRMGLERVSGIDIARFCCTIDHPENDTLSDAGHWSRCCIWKRRHESLPHHRLRLRHCTLQQNVSPIVASSKPHTQ